VISSDLSRAVATADAITGRPRLPHDPRLREMNFGLWEMRSFAQIEAETPDLIRSFWETPGEVRPPKGESWNQLCDRVLAALSALDGTAPDIIVVAHFSPIVAALQIAEGLAPEAAFAHRIDNLSVTALTLRPAQTFAINHKP
jgi:broad specificity phosphatase PhoE